MSFSLPILQLPLSDLKRVLGSMEVSDLLFFSLCSRKTKLLVKHLNLGKPAIEAFCLINSFGFEISYDGDKVFELSPPSIEQSAPRDGITFSMDDIDQKEGRILLDHFLDVFNTSKVFEFLCLVGYRGDECASQTLDGLEIGLLRTIEWDENTGAFKDIIKKHAHRASSLYITLSRTFSPLSCQSTLIQNFESITFPPQSGLKMNDLLLLNASGVRLNLAHWSSKMLNRFLKLWIAGSNSRLRYFRIHGFDRESILQGINHQVIDDNVEREVESISRDGSSQLVGIKGGIDFRRSDGRKVTMIIDPENTAMQFYVL